MTGPTGEPNALRLLGLSPGATVCGEAARHRSPEANAAIGAVPPASGASSSGSAAPSFLSPDWVPIAPAASPPARDAAASAWDPAHHVTVVFGGCGAVCPTNDTWTLATKADGTTVWNQHVTAAPSPRQGAAMAWFPTLGNGTMVLFGGQSATGVELNDTWSWDGSTWTQLSPAAAPPGRHLAALTFDKALSALMLFGGSGAGGPLADTWVLTASGWFVLHPTVSPPPRYGSSLAYDDATATDVLFGGRNVSAPFADTWTFKGATWTQAAVAAPPPGRAGFALAYDPDLKVVVLFGGGVGQGSLGTVFNDTWAWNGSLWQSAGPISSPSSRGLVSFAYDADHHDVVLFGGATLANNQVVFTNETWTYSAQLPVLSVSANATGPLSQGAGVTFSAQVANAGLAPMNGVTFTDTLPATLSLLGTTVSIVQASKPSLSVPCTGACTVKVTATSVSVGPLALAAVDGVIISYTAVAAGGVVACASYADAASAANALGATPVQSASVNLCGTGLGVEPWQSYLTRALGPQSAAKVNVANGNLVVQATDSTPVQARGHLAFALQRTYNSEDSATVGPLGVGWTLGLAGVGQATGAGGGMGLANLSLLVPALELPNQPLPVTVVTGSGARETFTSTGTALNIQLAPGLLPATLSNLLTKVLTAATNSSICVDQSFQAPPGVHMSLFRYLQVSTGSGSCNQGGSVWSLGWALEETNGTRYEFAAGGQLLDVVDRAGVELRYLYNKAPAAGGLPPSSVLMAVYEPQSCAGHANDTFLNPLNPLPSSCRTIAFDYSKAHEVDVVDPAKRTTRYVLDTQNPAHLTSVVNPDGSSINYTYGCAGAATNQLCSASDANDRPGVSSQFTYQSNPLGPSFALPAIASVTDRRGVTSTFTYGTSSGLGTATVVEDPGDPTTVAHQTYYSAIDAAGRVGSVAEGSVAGGGTYSRLTVQTWDVPGATCRLPDQTVDNNRCGEVERAFNDGQTGSALGITTPDRVSSWVYGDEGQVLDARQAMGAGYHATPPASAPLDTTYGYHVQYFEGNGTLNCRDDTPAGMGAVTQTTSCGQRDSPDAITLFALVDRTSLLPPSGNQASAAARDSFATTYVVDDTSPGGGGQGPNVFPIVAAPLDANHLYCNAGSYAADTGAVCSVRSPSPTGSGNALTTNVYDVFGAKTTMTTPKANAEAPGHSYAYAYYGAGTNDLSAAVSAAGWLKGVTDPAGAFVAYAYDAAGNVARSWDRTATAAAGLPLSAYPGTLAAPTSCLYAETLHAPGGVAGVATPCQSSTPLSAVAGPWRYLRSSRDPLGNMTSYVVDSNGNPTTVEPPRGNAASSAAFSTTQTFDNDDNLATRTLPLGDSDTTTPATTIYTYDPFDNLVTVQDPRQHVTAYSYDAVNRRTKTARSRFTPSSAGPAGSCPTVKGDPIFSDSQVCTTSLTYDGLNNVVVSTDANGVPTSFGYDGAGRRITTSARGLLRGSVVPLRTDTVYDPNGNPTDLCPPREFDPAEPGSAGAQNPTTPACTSGGIYSTHDTYSPANSKLSVTTYHPAVASSGTQPATTTYGYDADGNAVQVTNPDGTAAAGSPPVLPNAYTVVSAFDLLDRRVCQAVPRQSQAATGTVCPGVPAALATSVSYGTTMSNYDPSGDMINQTLPPGGDTVAVTRTSAWSYDADHRLLDSVTGAATTAGKPLGPTDTAAQAGLPDGNGGTNIRTRVAYDPDGHVVSTWAPRAFVPYAAVADPRTNPNPDFLRSVSYDVDGRAVADAQPRYDSLALRSLGPSPTPSIQCPVGAPGYPATTGVCITRAAYDASGNVKRITLPTDSEPAHNRHVDFAWTDDNLRLSVTAPDPSTDGARVVAWSYTYDPAGQTTTVADAYGDTTTTTYTPDHRVLSVTQPKQAGPVQQSVTYGYDANGNTAAVTDGQGNAALSDYTPDNLAADRTDGAGDKTSYGYDRAGNPLTVTSPSANAADATNPLGVATTNTYTLDNLLSSATTPAAESTKVDLWRQTAYLYDLAGHKSRQQTTTAAAPTATPPPAPPPESCGSLDVECFGYYADDRPASQQGRGGKDSIVTTYDADGNPISTADSTSLPAASTSTVAATYYLDDLLRSVDDGNQTTSYGYDGQGHVAARVQAADALLSPVHNTQYLYNDAGVAVAGAADLVGANSNPAVAPRWTWQYDKAGRATTQTDPNGQVETTSYNADDTVSGKTVAAPGGATTLAQWAFSYNNNGQILTQTLSSAVGAPGASTGSCNPQGSAGPCSGTLGYQYDKAGRLMTSTDAGGSRAVTYDHDGNRTTYGVARQSYNPDDTINQATTPGGTQTYQYNPAGTLRSDGCTTYGYDGFDRTTTIADSGAAGCGAASTVNYTYDGLDRQRSHVDATPLVPLTTTLSYDGRSSSVASETPLGVTSLIATGYTLDAGGRPLAETALGGLNTSQLLATDGTATVALVTTDNAQSTVACTARFDPYGTPINPQPGDSQHVCNTGATANDRFVNAARHDATTGTYEYGSRTYDPAKGAFLSPDSYRAAPPQASQSLGTDPLTRNSYAYVNGDPVNLTDLGGHCPDTYGPIGARCNWASPATANASNISNGIPWMLAALARPKAKKLSCPFYDPFCQASNFIAEAQGAVTGWIDDASTWAQNQVNNTFGQSSLIAQVLDSQIQETAATIHGVVDSVGGIAQTVTTVASLSPLGAVVSTADVLTGHGDLVRQRMSAALNIVKGAVAQASPLGLVSAIGQVRSLATAYRKGGLQAVDLQLHYMTGKALPLVALAALGGVADAPVPAGDIPTVAAETEPALADQAPSVERNFYHYTDEPGRAGIDASGQINPGAASGKVFVSPTEYADPFTAQSELSLPRTPTAGYYEVPESRLPGLTQPTPVQPAYGQPGGGLECWVTCPVDVSGLKFNPWGP